jgi:hypothetical protein
MEEKGLKVWNETDDAEMGGGEEEFLKQTLARKNECG